LLAALRRYGLDRTLHLDASIATAQGLAANVAALRTEVAGLKAEVSRLGAESVFVAWERDQARGQLAAIWSSRAWAVVQFLQRSRQRVLPTGSRRERMVRAAWRALGGGRKGPGGAA
jgi:hypothetical protein